MFSSNDTWPAIAHMLGIPPEVANNTVSASVRFEVDTAVTVEVTYYPERQSIEDPDTITARYKLIEVSEQS